MITAKQRAISSGRSPQGARQPVDRRRSRPRIRPCLEWMEDRTLLSTFIVSNTADTGPGSLRQAILDSDAAKGVTNKINFAIPGQGVQAIAPLSPLPTISNPVLIDGFSQPGYAGTPLIELSGSQAGSVDGLTITGSDVTVRSLDINSFAIGAGILITGMAATGNTIEANDIGTDPTGLQALPNDFGVQILGGASHNLVGGTSAAAGNLIAFNMGPGVDVEGDGSVGNQITANRIFSNDDRGALQFHGSSDVSLPNNLIRGFEQEETIEAWFKTTGGGVILGYQGSPTNSPGQPAGWVPALYVGTDGKLYGDVWSLPQVFSNGAVNDGRWHQVTLVVDGASDAQSLYLDGQLAGTGVGSITDFGGTYDQIGTGYTDGWTAAPGGWYGFTGQTADVRIWSVARTPGQVQQDMTTAPAATEPGLEADYPLDDGQGLTAHDLTSNHNDGTLAGLSGDLPTWVNGSGEAIDLGDDGITYNANAPRQGPNNFQNLPIIAMTADGQLEGWLGGSKPEETFRIDLFASAGYGPGGAGEAQDYLGSLEVTTDSQGQAVFDVPFSPPAGLPMVTATATDPLGNTSEVSAQRRASLEVPSQYVREVSGQPLILSASSGDGVALQDPDAGPLDVTWELTLSVTAGTVTLSGTNGLVGSGDGTGKLQYQGSLSALNVALEGMSFAPAAGSHGNFAVNLNADSDGAPALQAQANITDGFFSVTTTADSGPGSLRQAILDSDAASGAANTISFAIPGQGVQTIAPLSPLPPITNPVLIDGFSQPGYAGAPLIELSGSQAGTGDGLTITGANVTVRGLDINSFASGAGILISGMAATGNTIEANDIGTDPTGVQTLPNDFGVQILGGGSNNLVGGTTAAAGNLITFNTGPGVDVEGDGSVGNQITANRIFSNADRGALHFDGSSDVSLPNNLISGFEQQETIEASFQTTSGGVILGYQSASAGTDLYSGWDPLLYVGTDGKLYGELYTGSVNPIASDVAVNDGQWHNVALVVDGAAQTETLYLDGQLVGSVSGAAQDFGGSYDQIGTGYTVGSWPAAPRGWYGFVGQINNVRIWSVARTAGQVQQDITTAPAATEPGLEADFPLGDGQGLTAHDLTSNHNDGTLAGYRGDLPTWVVNGTGEAIDLGDDGITYNSSAPRQGPNNFQNFPIIVTTADGQLEGWLGGSTPEETFRIDLFASAGYGPGGAGDAQDYLGSLEVTTDSQGQAVFDVPFTPPAGLPAVTATATDPEGNTSEVSASRRLSVQAPTQSVRDVPGQPLIFSAASGDGISLQDPDAGPFDLTWDLTVSVAGRTLTLASTAGLTGSGDGTGSLSYSGPLSALNAALEGMTLTSPSPQGNFTISLDAQSAGGTAVQAEVNIIDGFLWVTTTADSGPGSLRQAILDSDAETGGTNTIDFAIPGQGVQTIAPLSPLPAITNPVLIDGFSQPGYSGTPLIELSGNQVQQNNSGTVTYNSGDGLTITGSDVTVRGLDINTFSQGAGIHITGSGATGNWVYGNFLGTDPTGTQADPNDYGVEIDGGASGNLIGTNGDGVNDAAERNLLSGNSYAACGSLVKARMATSSRATISEPTSPRRARWATPARYSTPTTIPSTPVWGSFTAPLPTGSESTQTAAWPSLTWAMSSPVMATLGSRLSARIRTSSPETRSARTAAGFHHCPTPTMASRSSRARVITPSAGR